MLDNASPYTALIVRDYLINRDIPQMEWPPYSSGQNPIENVWDMLAR